MLLSSHPSPPAYLPFSWPGRLAPSVCVSRLYKPDPSSPAPPHLISLFFLFLPGLPSLLPPSPPPSTAAAVTTSPHTHTYILGHHPASSSQLPADQRVGGSKGNLLMDMAHERSDASSEEEVMAGELRRGPWTVEEDLQLVNYVDAHGEGRWNSLARSAGVWEAS
jgi:hypothetical protein